MTIAETKAQRRRRKKNKRKRKNKMIRRIPRVRVANHDLEAIQYDSLEKDFTCMICSRIYEKPTTALCGHSFCIRCIRASIFKSIISKKSIFKPNKHAKCPKCKVKISHFGYKVNISLRKLVDQVFPHEVVARRVEQHIRFDDSDSG